MIRNPNPRGLAFIIALALSVLTGLSSFLLRDPLWETLVMMGLVLIFGYLLFFYALEIFIYRKIKLIYKTIHRYKTEKKGLFENLPDSSDPLNEVRQEVMEWAVQQQHEIELLKKQESYRKEFLGNVSHELKTPIFNIQGYLHTLIDGALEDPEVNIHFLKKAAKSVDRLVDLVQDLISISQLETGEMHMEMEKFDVNALVKDVYDSLDMRARERNVTLTIKEGCDEPFIVYADKFRIRQVVVNLVMNAIKYGKEGGKVAVAYYDMDENFLVEVSDNGDGIQEEHLPRLFERFYRVDRSRSREQGGTGLGLAIVKHIIEAHKQTINVRSTLGKGTTFGFTLKKGAEKFSLI